MKPSRCCYIDPIVCAKTAVSEIHGPLRGPIRQTIDERNSLDFEHSFYSI